MGKATTLQYVLTHNLPPQNSMHKRTLHLVPRYDVTVSITGRPVALVTVTYDHVTRVCDLVTSPGVRRDLVGEDALDEGGGDGGGLDPLGVGGEGGGRGCQGLKD